MSQLNVWLWDAGV